MQHRIAEAAIEEIKLRGMKFTIRDVAARLGISTKTMYQHFASKTEIITYLIEQAIDEMRQSEEQLMKDRSLTLVQKMEQALLMLPSAVAFMDIRTLDELKRAYPAQWEQVDAYVQQGWNNIRQMMAEATEQQLIRPIDMELFIHMYVGAFYQLMNQRTSGISLTEGLQVVVDILLRGILRESSKH